MVGSASSLMQRDLELEQVGRGRSGRVPAAVRANGWSGSVSRPQAPPAQRGLEAIAVLNAIRPETRARIERHCSWRWYQPKELIVDYLDSSDEVYFLVAGAARVSIYSVGGKTVTFGDLRAGDIFGEYAAIDAAPRSASIEARTSCLVASMPAAAFRDVLQSEPAVSLALLRQLVGRVRAMSTRVYEFSALGVSHRIQTELLRLAKLTPGADKSSIIAPGPTNAEIASRISTHREAVSRELNRLSRLGILERRGGALIVKDVERLAAMIHEVTGE